MNTMALENRVKRIEEKARLTTNRFIVFHWDRGHGETEEEVGQRFRLEHPEATDDDIVIYICKWSDGTAELPLYGREPQKEEPVSADTEIDEILTDLQGQGLTMEEIAAMVKEAEGVGALEGTKMGTVSPKTEPALTQFDKGVSKRHREIEKKQEVKSEEQPSPQPMRCDELTAMFRGRR